MSAPVSASARWGWRWEQLRAILWLRWCLSRNGLRRAGPVNAVLAMVLLFGLVLGSIASGVGGFAAGFLAFRNTPPGVLLLVWDGLGLAFLIFWLSGLLVEIQRSEGIDLTKLLHLPVTLPQVFAFNYMGSHLTPSIVLCLPGMLGLSAGLSCGVDWRMVWLVPLVLSWVFLLTAATYCLRGWLAALMVNQRRRRSIVVWVTIGFLLIFQLPNLLFQSRLIHTKGQDSSAAQDGMGRRRLGRLDLPEAFVWGHLVVPPGWVGYGAMTLREGNPWPAAGATAAGCMAGVLVLMRAYRMTLRFYQGGESRGTVPAAASQSSVRANEAPRRTKGRLMVERQLPWLPDDVAGLALATLRSMLRAPELKMAFIMPIVAGAALIAIPIVKIGPGPTEWLVPIAVVVVAVVASFSFAPTMSNTFGLDRDGFRALVLLPTRREHVLLAKNLAVFPFVAGVAVVFLVLLKLRLGIGAGQMLAGLLQTVMVFLLFSLAGNLLSILAPYRLAPGTLQAKKPKPIVFLAAFLLMVALPIIAVPVLVPPLLQALFVYYGWMQWLPVNLLASAMLAPVVAGVYWLALPLQGRLLERREQTILRDVTEEVE